MILILPQAIESSETHCPLEYGVQHDPSTLRYEATTWRSVRAR